MNKQQKQAKSLGPILSLLGSVGLMGLSLLMHHNIPVVSWSVLGCSGLWLLFSIFYCYEHRWGYWGSFIICALLLSLFLFQFGRRVYAFIYYGGEAPDGSGSPALFLINWFLEMIPTSGLILLFILLICDYKRLKNKQPEIL